MSRSEKLMCELGTHDIGEMARTCKLEHPSCIVWYIAGSCYHSCGEAWGQQGLSALLEELVASLCYTFSSCFLNAAWFTLNIICGVYH